MHKNHSYYTKIQWKRLSKLYPKNDSFSFFTKNLSYNGGEKVESGDEMGQLLNDLKQIFIDQFGDEPKESFFAPGRVNLIGEHTDYNGGHVFPCAITLGTYAWVKARTDNKLRLYSANFTKDGIRELDMDDLGYKSEDSWANYVKGVFIYLAELGFAFPHGLDIAFYGNIPNGSGLSSSASFELLVGVIARKVYSLDIDTLGLVKIGKRVENDFMGVNSGIMDQFAVGMGKKDHAIFLDCATLEYELVPVELGDYRIVIMNTNKRRELADSKYNERFFETQTALKELQEHVPIHSLGDLTMDTFDAVKQYLSSELLVKRARHAVSENERTKLATEVLKKGDLSHFGRLMNESHLSTELDYEVTGKELDTLVHTAWEQAGVLGARMTGAGFGGCAIALVHKDHIDAFKANVAKVYTEEIGYAPSFYIAEIADGAH